MTGFRQSDIDALRKSLENMRPELNRDQYAVLDSVTIKIEDLASVGIASNITHLDRIVCWTVLLVTVDNIYRLAMEERYNDVDEGLVLFNDTVDYLMKGERE